jgi:hypothetical protein
MKLFCLVVCFCMTTTITKPLQYTGICSIQPSRQSTHERDRVHSEKAERMIYSEILGLSMGRRRVFSPLLLVTSHAVSWCNLGLANRYIPNTAQETFKNLAQKQEPSPKTMMANPDYSVPPPRSLKKKSKSSTTLAE